MKQINPKYQRGFTMLELLCCVAIILILVGLMMGPVMKAYKRAKKLSEEVQ
jgi:prepilin-type N-terminal cleavage/methylation domain-containing protein